MTPHPITSACRSCRYYTPEGRRGGHCQQLSVPVRGSWQACSLAIPAFAPSGENFETMLMWQKLREALPLEASSESPQLHPCEPKSASIAEAPKTQPLPVY